MPKSKNRAPNPEGTQVPSYWLGQKKATTGNFGCYTRLVSNCCDMTLVPAEDWVCVFILSWEAIGKCNDECKITVNSGCTILNVHAFNKLVEKGLLSG